MSSPLRARDMGGAVYTPFEAFALGQRATLDWVVSRDEIARFADLSGDKNPLHVDSEFARARGFPDIVSHGYLMGAKISALVGMLLPGRDCLILETTMAYPQACHPGNLIRIEGEIDLLSREQRVLRLRIRAYRSEPHGEQIVARGSVLCRSQ